MTTILRAAPAAGTAQPQQRSPSSAAPAAQPRQRSPGSAAPAAQPWSAVLSAILLLLAAVYLEEGPMNLDDAPADIEIMTPC